MEAKNTMTYQELLEQGIVKEGDYFQVKYPDGQKVLFQLKMKEIGNYVLLGPPTKGKIFLEGKNGYDRIFILADAQVKGEYAFEGVFEEVYALGVDEKQYTFQSRNGLIDFLKGVGRMFNNHDDTGNMYFLASRCEINSSTYSSFRVFYMDNGNMNAYWLYSTNGFQYNYALPVRPEAIPKPDLKIVVEARRGSKKKPWVCDVDNGGMEEEEISNNEVQGNTIGWKKKVEKWIAELKEYI